MLKPILPSILLLLMASSVSGMPLSSPTATPPSYESTTRLPPIPIVTPSLAPQVPTQPIPNPILTPFPIPIDLVPPPLQAYSQFPPIPLEPPLQAYSKLPPIEPLPIRPVKVNQSNQPLPTQLIPIDIEPIYVDNDPLDIRVMPRPVMSKIPPMPTAAAAPIPTTSRASSSSPAPSKSVESGPVPTPTTKSAENKQKPAADLDAQQSPLGVRENAGGLSVHELPL
ncbi:hypothetical protein QBC43DRAFT_290953 [Cladorrhinum sp. PSN259]|nr:hypothetical protein QBC43DRAFT_290953 [Cladorrhinum sp. PSN259]